MTSLMNYRNGMMFVVAIVIICAIAVGSSVWAKGGQTTMTDTVRMDTWAMHGAVDVAGMPVMLVRDPF